MVSVPGCCVGDTVCLRPRRGCDCWCRGLLCTRQARFGFLRPGEYVLSMRSGGSCLELLVRLPPGGNVEVWWEPAVGWRWRSDPFHYFFNQA